LATVDHRKIAEVGPQEAFLKRTPVP
jgi:hypothetical protein